MPRAKKVRGVRCVAPGKYQVRVRFLSPETGKEVARFETLEGVTIAEAKARRDEIRVELEDALNGPPKPVDLTLRTYATSWLTSMLRSLGRATGIRYAGDLETHVLPLLGDLPLVELTGRDVRGWLAETAKKVKPNGKPYSGETVAGWYRVLHTVLNAAAADGVIPFNPASHIKPPRNLESGAAKQALTPEELGKVLCLARVHEPDYYAFLSVLALTGMRHGEAAGLRWEDVDETSGVIRIRRSATRGILGSTKTRKTRVVGLSPALQETLREHREALEREGHPGLDEGWMFPVYGKLPKDASPDAPRPAALRHHTALSKPLKRLLELAGIDKHVTVHGLRRSHVDVLRRLGVDAVVEHATVGHSSERMREHYSHVAFDERRHAAEGVARLVLSRSDASAAAVGGGAGDQNGS